MFLDDLQKRFADMQTKAGVRTVFGDPIQLDGRTVIPVASVQYGFGMGGGSGPKKEEGEAPGGGGGGGGMRIEPVAIVEIANGKTTVRPIVNVARIVAIGALLAAWGIFWMTRTMRVMASTWAREFAQTKRPRSPEAP